MKKRVLQLIGSFHQGGSERQAIALTRLLKKDGTFDVFAATLNKEGVLASEIESLGLPEIPEFRLTSFYNLNFVRQVRRCSQYLKENKINIVQTHDFYTNIFGMAAASLARVPARVASKRETSVMRSKSQDFIEKLAFRRANAIVANSDAVRKHLIERSIPSDKIRVIHNGIDLGRFDGPFADRSTICKNLGLLTDENIQFVTLVANLRHKVKNVPMLLRAAKRVVEKIPAAHFVIAGEGELEQELKTFASETDIAGNTHFIGRCMDVPALLSVSDVCVLTSSAEGFSNSILEYMAAGKPVVATIVVGAAEAIADGETGYLVAPDDDEAMAGYLIELLEDEEKAKVMGENGKRIAGGKFSLASQLSKTLELYDECLSK